jgi:hypothetical protein
MDMNPPPRRVRSRVADVALVLSFLGLLWLPLAVQSLGLDLGKLAENRARATCPELKLQRDVLAAFPARFEAYFNDSFGLRDQLIRGNNLVRVSLLGISTSSQVMIGRRGWLYYLASGAIDDLRGTHPLSQEELARWAEALEERRDWLERRGIRYLVMFAPNKHTIYPEYMPVSFRRVSRETRYDQLYRYLREHTRLELLDLREPLLKAKSEARLFYRRDTHWNDHGAFIAYQAIATALGRWYPRMDPSPLSSFRPVGMVRKNPDLSLLLGLGEELPDRDYTLEPRFTRQAREADPGPGLSRREIPDKWPVAMECDDPGLPRAVFFRDSFSIALIPLLSEHFSRSLYLWHCGFDAEIVEREHPQIVIEEAVERTLWSPPPTTMIARKEKDGSRSSSIVK